MLNSQTHRGLHHLQGIITFTTRKSLTLEFYPLLKLQLHPLTPPPSFSLQLFKFTTTSDPRSFTVSYLIHNYGLSPDSALGVSRKLRLDNPQKPDSVLAFLRSRGFSNSQIRRIVEREVNILLCDPDKVLSPKFEFLRSKGASSADIVHMVSTGPRLLSRSLEKHIVPAYEFLRGFLHSDDQIIACMMRNSCFFSDGRVALNSKLLLDNGVKPSDIANMLRRWPSVLCSSNLLKTVEELKEMKFNSSTSTFGVALLAKRTVSKTKWDGKVEIFKKWGWSQEHVLEAFKKQPYCMLTSVDKLEAMLNFWVNQLGCDSLDLVKAPILFQLSLHKRIVPRASVVQFLLSKGLRKKGASWIVPFVITEKSFLEKFVNRFEDHSSHLLKIYEENMNLANNKESACL